MVAYTREDHYRGLYPPLYYVQGIEETIWKGFNDNRRMFKGNKGDSNSQKKLQVEVISGINAKLLFPFERYNMLLYSLIFAALMTITSWNLYLPCP